jgi:hypothetical protein
MTRPQQNQGGARDREAGQSPVMAVLVLAAIAITVAIFLTGRLALATTARSEALHGADAAALAGAQAVLDGIPGAVAPGFLSPTDVPELLGGGRCLQTGRGEAARLARANGDSLTDYCYNSFTDEISVTVSGDDGGRAEATAATSFDASACSLAPGFTPPTKDPDNDNDDEPVTPARTLLDCGIDNLVVTYNPADARFHFVGLEAVLADVEPRLTR